MLKDACKETRHLCIHNYKKKLTSVLQSLIAGENEEIFYESMRSGCGDEIRRKRYGWRHSTNMTK